MKIIEVKNLAIPGVKTIRFERFSDNRGYFSEIFSRRDIDKVPELNFLNDYGLSQANESFSKAGVIRGLHFQWQPPLEKVLRVVSGHMVDMILDIRKDSPTEGKVILYDMPASSTLEYNEWLCLPAGVAHGSFFLRDSIVEYFFRSYYNPECESGISPLASDLDWSLCDPALKEKFEIFKKGDILISEKDKNNGSFRQWRDDPKSNNFIYA